MITGVTGLNGAGKTSFAVGVLAGFRRRGIKTAANIDVKGSTYVRNFDDLLKLRDCVLLVDEVTAVASSRQFATLSPEALLFFQTLRHANVGLIWTAPTFDRCDLALRGLTLHWYHLSSLVSTLPRPNGIWRNTHLALVRSGRPTEGLDGPKMLAPWFSLYRPAANFTDYDSFADVDLFARGIRFPGRCPGCGSSIDYGRVRASLRPVPLAEQLDSLHCPKCSTFLGTPTLPRVADNDDFTAQGIVPRLE